jgi:hypothetical protein
MVLRRLLAVLLALAATTAAGAKDGSGQYPGVYVVEGSRQTMTAAELELLQLKCVLAPGVMHSDGFGVGYFLDRELFRATGQVAYIKGQEYRCHYTPSTRMETCASKEFSDGKSLSYYRTNVYQVFSPVLQRGHSLFTPEEVAAWNSSGALNPAGYFAYHQCVCISDKQVEARALSQPNLLPGSETGKRLFWRNIDPTDADYDLARQIVKMLGNCRPNVS